MPCGWEGHRRSGVALATCQTLVVLHLRTQGLEEGDEHPPTLSHGAQSTLPLHTVVTSEAEQQHCAHAMATTLHFKHTVSSVY